MKYNNQDIIFFTSVSTNISDIALTDLHIQLQTAPSPEHHKGR